MNLSIVIPTWNRCGLLKACLAAIACDRENFPTLESVETIVVDNGSTDRTREIVRAFGWPRLIELPKNIGFAMACNRGANESDADNLCFLNNDTLPNPGWLAPLLAILRENRDIAAVGPKMIYPEGLIQCAGVEVIYDARGGLVRAREAFRGKPAATPLANERRDCVLTGACLMVRAAAFKSVGKFHTGYYNGCEDVDLCLSLQGCGWRTVYEPASVVVHLESQSDRRERFAKRDANRELLRQRWSAANGLRNQHQPGRGTERG